MQKKEYTLEIGGKTLTAEFNDLADQADGSVLLKYGNTAILATAVMSQKPKEGAGWFPLTVDYEEKFYAAGRILGGRFMKREGRPSDEAILTSRIVDRTIRPLFEQHIRHDIQVVITVLSIDEDDPDILAILGASLALGVSDIPWGGPVSAVRVAKKKGEDDLEINPTYEFRNDGGPELEAVVCGKDGKINMIEVGSEEAPEGVVTESFKKGLEEIEKLQGFQEKIISEIGRTKREVPKPEAPEELKNLFQEKIEGRVEEVVFSGVAGKEKISELKEEWMNLVKESLPEADKSLVTEIFEESINQTLHKGVLEENKRADGRGMDELRSLYAQAGGISPILHGSGIFYRGGTHILSALTLGGPGDTQLIEGMEVQTDKRFMHHYNFPPFSVGEAGRIGGFNRRAIGHGALAEKALLPILPPKEDFPYTIRIVSESMASNGSTSMGSVCGSTLALMDAGVPIKAPVAGIASGLMMDDQGNYKVLTDIQGPEDEHGDMDFKVAGTKEGVTAIQMDVKVSGIPVEALSEALEKARSARLKILEVIEKEIAKPREKISPKAPEILMTKIKPDQIGLVIGPGGKTINEIKDKTGAEIDIEEDGSVFVTGRDGGAREAVKLIEELTKEYEKGERYTGEVMKITDFGIFVKIGPNTEGLVHVSEMAPWRVEKIESLVSLGDKVPIIIKDIDERDRLKLSIKDSDPSFFENKKNG